MQVTENNFIPYMDRQGVAAILKILVSINFFLVTTFGIGRAVILYDI